MKSLTEAIHHRCATSDNNRLAQVASQVNVTTLNASVDHLVNTWVLESDKAWLEKNLRCLRLDFIVYRNAGSTRQDVFCCLPLRLFPLIPDLHSLLLFLKLLCDIMQLGVWRQLLEELGSLGLYIAE